MTRPRGRVDNLVIEYGKVEREAEPDGVCGLHFGLGDVERLLVGLLRVLHHGCGQARPLVRGGGRAPRASQHGAQREDNDLFGELTRFIWRI